MNAVFAALPIVTALGLLAARVRPTRAALSALACGLVVAVSIFSAPPADLLRAEAAMLGIMAEVALILLGGLTLNRLLDATGSQARLGDWLLSHVRAPERAVLTIVLGVVPFAESVTGFGIGSVVGIALLRRIGLTPLPATVCGLLGLVSVPWGSLGPGTLVAARLTGVDFQALGMASAALSGVVYFVMGFSALWVSLGSGALRRAAIDLVLAAGAIWAGTWTANSIIGTPLAGVLGSLAAIIVMLVRARQTKTRRASARPLRRRDLAPYAVLVTGLLVTHLLPDLGWPAWAARALASPATWLLTTCAVIPLLFRRPVLNTPKLVGHALRQWQPIALTTLAFLALGVLLANSGMSAALAAAGARLGAGYPIAAPWLGALGGFLTGSNTGASAMFAASQAQTAAAIGYPVVTMVALQNVGASLAIMAAIPKIIMAASVAHNTDTALSAPANSTEATSGRVLTRVLAADAAALVLLSLIAAWPA